MPALLLAALLSASPAAAWVIDLGQGGQPLPAIDGHPASAVVLPSSVLARQEPLRFLGARGTSVRGVGGLACAVHLDDGTGMLSPAYDQCARIYEAAPGAWTDLLVHAAPAPARVLRLLTPVPDDGGAVALDEARRLVLPGVPAEAHEASLFFGGRWWTAGVDPGTGLLTTEGPAGAALAGWLAAPGDVLVVRVARGDGREVQWRLFPEDLPVELPRPAPVALAAPVAAPLSAWCRPELDAGHHGPTFLVCLDADTGQVATRRYLANGTIAELDTRSLPTGHFLELAVRHAEGAAPTAELLVGTPPGEAPAPRAAPAPPAVARTITHRRFAPRPPGASTLVVHGPDGQLLAREALQVVRRDGAAIRLGLGLALPASQAYAVVATEEDVTQGEIVRDGRRLLEGEILVGISPFLEPGGRDRMAPMPYRMAPTFALGLLSASGSTLRLSLLQSFWAGVELELTPGVAVTGAFTLRRLERLVDGAEVGDAIDAADPAPTGRVFRPGLGVALSLTPEGLRLPARGR